MALRRFAAIDIGTVTCRMLVADVLPGNTLHELRHEYAITNLGEGVDATQRLQPEAIERVVSTLERYQTILGELCAEDGIEPTVVAVATSASRDAENAADFQARVRGLGLNVQVIPGQEEASLSFEGACAAFPGEQVVVVDVGGGSTEVSAGKSGSSPAYSHSFDIGCRRITERFFKSDPPVAAEIDAAREWIRAEMGAYFATLENAGYGSARMVAVAGTATTVVSIREHMAVYDSARVHGAVVTRAGLDEVEGSLSRMTLDARRRVVGLDPGRAPVIVAGLVVLQEVMSLLGADSFTVSESDILQGLVLRASKNNGSLTSNLC